MKYRLEVTKADKGGDYEDYELLVEVMEDINDVENASIILEETKTWIPYSELRKLMDIIEMR